MAIIPQQVITIDQEIQISIAQMKSHRLRNALQFSVLKNQQLASRAELVRLEWSVLEDDYTAFIVRGMLTVPHLQRQGYGTQLMRIVTSYILNSDVDFGMLFCQPHLMSFYTLINWENCVYSENRMGTPDNFTQYPLQRFMLFVSERSEKIRSNFHHSPFYLNTPW